MYVLLGVYLVPQAVALEGLAPAAALKRSWAIADGNRWWLLLYLVVLRIFAVLGLLLCCVGVLGTGAMRIIAINESYLRFVHSDEEQREWWIVRGDDGNGSRGNSAGASPQSAESGLRKPAGEATPSLPE